MPEDIPEHIHGIERLSPEDAAWVRADLERSKDEDGPDEPEEMSAEERAELQQKAEIAHNERTGGTIPEDNPDQV